MRWDAIKRCLMSVAVMGPLAWPVSSMAAAGDADTASGALEEVVVTATRRSERLQDVPVSVLAFSQEKLDAQGLKNIDDLSRLSPGVNFQRNGMSSAGNYNDEGSDINIRGVDSTAGTSTTGIYIDDSPIQTRHIGFGSINAFPALFDLDRVEVLRGPQGTLFGAGAEGGVVRFIAPEPDLNKSTAYARADAADTDGGAASYEGGAALGAPIIDDVLAFRASVSFRRDGGWVDRVGYTLSPNNTVALPTPVYNGDTTQSNANFSETTTARLAVKWKVSDTLEITPSIYYQRLQINDTSAYWIALSDPSSGVYRNGNAGTNPSSDPFSLSAIKIKWDLGFASLFSNTSFYDRNQRATSDYTQYLRATWSSISSFIPSGVPAYQLPEHLSVAWRQRLCHVSGRSAQFLSGIPPGFDRHERADRLERRTLLLALERERAGEHHRSDAEFGSARLFRSHPRGTGVRAALPALSERANIHRPARQGHRQADRAVR